MSPRESGGDASLHDAPKFLSDAQIVEAQGVAGAVLPAERVAALAKIEEWTRFTEIYSALKKLAGDTTNPAAIQADRCAEDVTFHVGAFLDPARLAEYERGTAHLSDDRRAAERTNFYENSITTLYFRLQEAARMIAEAGVLLEGVKPTEAETAILARDRENGCLDSIGRAVQEHILSLTPGAMKRLRNIIDSIGREKGVLKVDCSPLLTGPAPGDRENVVEWTRGNSNFPQPPSKRFVMYTHLVSAVLNPSLLHNRHDAELKRALEQIELAAIKPSGASRS